MPQVLEAIDKMSDAEKVSTMEYLDEFDVKIRQGETFFINRGKVVLTVGAVT